MVVAVTAPMVMTAPIPVMRTTGGSVVTAVTPVMAVMAVTPGGVLVVRDHQQRGQRFRQRRQSGR